MAHPIIITDEASRQRAVDHIANLSLEDGRKWAVTAKRWRKTRTLEQNNLYHGWVGIIADETGHSHDEIHEWCKAQFLPPQFIEIDGKMHEYRRSTASLNTADMSAYMDKVFAWASSTLGLILPLPPTAEQRG